MIDAAIGTAIVTIVNNGTRSPADQAEALTNRIINVAQEGPARDQATAYRDRIRWLIERALEGALMEERNYNALVAERAGSLEIAVAIRSR